jgi:hypothetical protein
VGRVVSASLRRELEKQESSEALLIFVTITHPTMDETIRVVSEPEGIDYVYGGETFIGFPFDIELLTDSERFPETRIAVQNVDETIGRAIKGLIGPPRVKIEILALSDFDTTVNPRTEIGTPTVEYSADKLYLIDVEIDAMQITGRIVSWNYSQEVWPGVRATQNRTPGLYR